jgi:hypothetical protein
LAHECRLAGLALKFEDAGYAEFAAEFTRFGCMSSVAPIG